MVSSLLAATASIFLLAGLGPIPIPIPIVPPSDPPVAPPPPSDPPPPPGPSPDPDGFPDVGDARFVDYGDAARSKPCWGANDCVEPRSHRRRSSAEDDPAPRADGKSAGSRSVSAIAGARRRRLLRRALRDRAQRPPQEPDRALSRGRSADHLHLAEAGEEVSDRARPLAGGDADEAEPALRQRRRGPGAGAARLRPALASGRSAHRAVERSGYDQPVDQVLLRRHLLRRPDRGGDPSRRRSQRRRRRPRHGRAQPQDRDRDAEDGGDSEPTATASFREARSRRTFERGSITSRAIAARATGARSGWTTSASTSPTERTADARPSYSAGRQALSALRSTLPLLLLRQLAMNLDASRHLVVLELLGAQRAAASPRRAGCPRSTQTWATTASPSRRSATPDDRRFANARSRDEDLLDLTWSHLLAARLDHVVAAADEMQMTILVEAEEVVRARDALPGPAPGTQSIGACLRVVPITLHDVSAADDQLARLARAEHVAGVILDPDLGAGNRLADRGRLRVDELGTQVGDPSRLGLSVHQEQLRLGNVSRIPATAVAGRAAPALVMKRRSG